MTLKIKDIEEGKTKEEIYNLALDLIQGTGQKDGKECRELAWMFFLKLHNSTSVFKEINPKEYNKNLQARKEGIKKKLNNNTITKCYGVWLRTNFFGVSEQAKIKKRASETPPKLIRRYILTLMPFFYYCEKKIGVKFSDEEINILRLIFLPEPVRKALYEEYKEIDFLEAILKYYVRFYIYYLENPTKEKYSHYFEKDFLDDWIFRKLELITEPIPIQEPLYNYNQKGHMLFNVAKPTKENKKSDELLCKYNLKFRNYWSLLQGPVVTHIRIGKKSSKKIISLGDWNPEKDYYSVYESLHIIYPEIMKKLDHKILEITLEGIPKKNK